MNTKYKITVIRILQLLAAGLMLCQILIALIWMAKNITVIPPYGDTEEYLFLSETFQMDEYRPILYPLILRIVRGWAGLTSTAYQVWLYLGQTVVSFLSLLYGVSVLDRVLQGSFSCSKRRMAVRVFLTLYLMSIPMITFMNFCVLTDSLAVSFLVIFLSEIILMFGTAEMSRKHYLFMGLTFLAQALLRADRLYSCLVMALIAFVVRIVRERSRHKDRINDRSEGQSKEQGKDQSKKLVVAMLFVCLVIPGTVKLVNAKTQTPGINGRIETNLDLILLDRVVWPRMARNRKYFPEDIKAVISKEAAKEFDKQNNNVMYQMAPLVEESVGKENAGKIYRQMAQIVWQHEAGAVLIDIGQDIASMFFTPFSSYLNAHGLWRKKGDAWNIYCLATKSKRATRLYNFYFQYAFFALLGIGMLISIISRITHRSLQGTRKFLRQTLPYWGMTLLLTLWFCLGDGAHPNDRYALIIYITWSMLAAGLCGFWNGDEELREEQKTVDTVE